MGVRVGLAENPDKVGNIVQSQQGELLEIYAPLAEQLGVKFESRSESRGAGGGDGGGVFSFDKSDQFLVGQLPEALRQKMSQGRRGGKRGSNDAEAPGEDTEALREALREALHTIVRRSSSIQSSKGVLTAGPMRGAQYLL